MKTYVMVLISSASDEYHNICFHGEIRKILVISDEKSTLNYLELCIYMYLSKCFHDSIWVGSE